MKHLLLVLLIVCVGSLPSEYAQALAIRTTGQTDIAPLTIERNSSDTSSIPLNLQLVNDSVATETVALWQLSLAVTGTSKSTGDVNIVGYSAPTIPFFVAPISPPTITTPIPQVTFQSADIPFPGELPGETISLDESRDLLTIELAGDGNALGLFQLVLLPLELPLEGSLWFGLSPTSQPFSNAPNSTNSDQIVLAEIYFIPETSTLTLIAMGGVAFILTRRC